MESRESRESRNPLRRLSRIPAEENTALSTSEDPPSVATETEPKLKAKVSAEDPPDPGFDTKTMSKIKFTGGGPLDGEHVIAKRFIIDNPKRRSATIRAFKTEPNGSFTVVERALYRRGGSGDTFEFEREFPTLMEKTPRKRTFRKSGAYISDLDYYEPAQA